MLENMYIKLRPTKKFQVETILGSGEPQVRKRR
jgi:hypothetical protein